ncbi:site-specific integrase [Phytohabitans sp. ZYX-F-186]|uniref:Site-specific integrase n=1 Tax=Phytohabitans maris TaxID=3071409 RepID=A0ABU0Z8Z9_9ACTN|nr:site-specific integrase [Phytohabitans sp. ZYX-F-186]MDQ7903536.1 site-specific integrase [Phytohabitans sp. ZYX-F-186]
MQIRAGSQYFFKRCSCRTVGACPRLRRPSGAWNPGHGRWHYRLELPPDPAGRRRQVRRGGYPSRRAALAARDHARGLLDLAAGDATATAEVAGLILAARHCRPLPPVEAVRRRLGARRALGGSTTVAVYLDRWLAHRLVDENTRRTYSSLIHAHLVPHLGEVALDRLRLDDIRGMFAAIEAANEQVRAARRSTHPAVRDSVRGRRVTGPGTCHRIRAVLRVALNDAVADGLIPTNPATVIRLRPARLARPLVWTQPRVDRWQDTGEVPGPVMVWTPEQTGVFLDHVARYDRDLYPLLHLVAHTGLRRGEAVGLREADALLDRAELAVTQQVTTAGRVLQRKPPKSGAGNRVVALDAGTVAVLRGYRVHRPSTRGGGLFFVREDGQPWHPDAVSRRFRRLVADAGLPPVRLHDLRHGAATLALAAGVDLKVVQATLGHSTMKLTADTYTSVLPELAQAAAEAVAAAIPRRSHWRRLDVPAPGGGVPGAAQRWGMRRNPPGPSREASPPRVGC